MKRAPKICLELASRMQELDVVKATPHWQATTLSDGYPGLISLFTEMEALFPNQGWGKKRDLCVEQLLKEIQTHGIGNHSLFTGMAGICFCLEGYPKLQEKFQAQLMQEVRARDLPPLWEIKAQKEGINPFRYDQIGGLCGILSVLLEHPEREGTQALLRDSLTLLVSLTEPIWVKGESVPGWFIPQRHLFQKVPHLVGRLDTGMAHGIAGCLAILSKAKMRGIEVPDQELAIRRILLWLRSVQGDIGLFKQVWPCQFDFQSADQGLSATAPTAYRDGWCYGAPGIVFSLFLAANALRDRALYQYCVGAMSAVCLRFQKHNTLIDLSLCHGYAGLLAMLHQMDLATGCKLFAKTALAVKRAIVKEYSEEARFGFETLLPDSEAPTERPEIFTIGLLNGTIGVVHSLLFHQSRQARPWLTLFLLK